MPTTELLTVAAIIAAVLFFSAGESADEAADRQFFAEATIEAHATFDR